MIFTVLMASTVPVGAADTIGEGDYTIEISNDTNATGVSIAGDTFHAFQIFIADDVTSYSVTDDFRGFFTGTLTGDDGESYNFQQYLTVINDSEYDTYTDEELENDNAYQTALNNYDQLAGKYMDSYSSNMYALAVQIRAYLDTYGAYVVEGGISCVVHAEALEADEYGYEYATLEGLDTGYYFIFDQGSAANGLGVSASGSFIPLTTGSNYTTTVEVKESIPTMTKNIYHDDAGVWDIVGDSQIGDTVEFRIISTLPSNIDDYIYDAVDNTSAINKYIYTLTDTMSAGLTYDGNVQVYTDTDKLYPVDEKYLTIVAAEDGSGFDLTVDVIELLNDDANIGTLYIFYSATLNEDAVTPNDYDTNTATLVYSSNPHDDDDMGSTTSTVNHFTFALQVNKVDESNNGLAGARYGLFDVDGNAIPLNEGDTDYATGLVSYYYDTSVDVISDGGYITTQTVALLDDTLNPTGETVTGKFIIYGLNDQTYYTLWEVEAPDGYNTSEQFDIYLTVTYDALGTSITHFTDGSTYVYTSQDNAGNWSSTSTIINRMKIYLPSTGGMGTVLFQVGGGAMMLGAVALLIVSHRKKEEK